MKKTLPETRIQAYCESPIGLLEVSGTEKGIQSLRFVDHMPAGGRRGASCLNECLKQLAEYFKGQRKVFSLELDLRGTEFQKSVWHELSKIPFGITVTYKDIAEALGRAQAARAVGGANHRNPVPVIVPCHRVIGAGGRLTGYGGGLWRKKWLIEHEKTRPASGPAKN